MTNRNEKAAGSSSAETPEASTQERIAALEAEMAGLVAERDQVAADVRRLRADEDPATGRYHAKAIFEAQQKKLALDTDIEFRRKKINRLRLGFDETDQSAPSGGFPF
jgi:hypothetical protein